MAQFEGKEMARITVEDCLDKVTNRFDLVILVARRAKALFRGAEPIVQTKGENKQVVTALREVAADHVNFKHDESLGSPIEQIEKDLNR